MTLDKQIQWISQHLPIVYGSGIFLLVTACIYAFISTQSFILVEVDKSDITPTLSTYVSTDSGITKTNNTTGLMLVSRNTKSLIVKKSDYVKTQVDVDFPWYGFVSKKINFQEDQNATKVAYKSTTGAECMTYSEELDMLSYYDCRNPKTILKYNTPKNKSWSASVVARLYYANGKATPYMGGVIGLADYSESKTASSRYSIVYTKPNGKILNYSAPELLTISSSMQGVQIFTDIGDSTNSRFVVVDPNGTIFLGTPQDDNVTYTTIKKPENYTENNNTLCSVHADRVVCYRGQSPVGDVEDTSMLKKIAGFSITSSNFDGTNQDTYKLENFGEPVDTISEVNGQLYGKAYKKLFSFDKKGDTYSAKELAQNVDSIAATDTLYYIQNDSIYAYSSEAKSANQVFHSPLLKLRTLLGTDSKLFFTARTIETSTVTYAYRLESSKNTSSRLIDKLPIAIDGTYSIDLVGNRLSITLSDVTRLVETRQIVDQNKLSAAKDEFISKLTTSGINLNTIELEFLY